MRKVIIPQLPTKLDRATQTRVPSIDVNPAQNWGDIRLLLPAGTVINERNVDDYVQQAKQSLRGTMCPSDYILCIGDVGLLGVIIATAVMDFGTVKLLRWSRDQHRYYETEVSI